MSNIRPNYTSLGGWTKEEYEHYWRTERQMEEAIEGGAFGTVITKGLRAGLKEARVNQHIRKATQRRTIVGRIKSLFNW